MQDSHLPHHEAIRALRSRIQRLDEDACALILREARTFNGWLDRDVQDDTLRELYDLAKWGPTSANCSPLRIRFVRSPAAKERLRACLAEGNVTKTMEAPVVAILAYDLGFPTTIRRLFPYRDMTAMFTSSTEFTQVSAFRNATLQGAYFLLAARALGLDTGPMSGFDHDKVDTAFFAATEIRSNFLCNLGYGKETTVFPRSPRLAFSEACEIL